MSIRVRKFEEKDMESMVSIWNEVVEEGVAYPQLDFLDEKTGQDPPYLADRHTAGWRRTWTPVKFWDCIFCIPIMWADAIIYQMPVMQSNHQPEESI